MQGILTSGYKYVVSRIREPIWPKSDLTTWGISGGT